MGNMIKSDLIAVLGRKITQLPEQKVADAVNVLLETMSESLVHGERIEIRGFGSFSLHYRAPRNAHNPKTGAKVVTEAKYSPHFKPGKELRELVDHAKNSV
jgi:integration host factor subunit beta